MELFISFRTRRIAGGLTIKTGSRPRQCRCGRAQ